MEQQRHDSLHHRHYLHAGRHRRHGNANLAHHLLSTASGVDEAAPHAQARHNDGRHRRVPSKHSRYRWHMRSHRCTVHVHTRHQPAQRQRPLRQRCLLLPTCVAGCTRCRRRKRRLCRQQPLDNLQPAALHHAIDIGHAADVHAAIAAAQRRESGGTLRQHRRHRRHVQPPLAHRHQLCNGGAVAQSYPTRRVCRCVTTAAAGHHHVTRCNDDVTSVRAVTQKCHDGVGVGDC